MTNQVNVDTVVADLKALMEMERESLSVSPNSEYFEGKIQAIKEFIEYLTGEVYE